MAQHIGEPGPVVTPDGLGTSFRSGLNTDLVTGDDTLFEPEAGVDETNVAGTFTGPTLTPQEINTYLRLINFSVFRYAPLDRYIGDPTDIEESKGRWTFTGVKRIREYWNFDAAGTPEDPNYTITTTEGGEAYLGLMAVKKADSTSYNVQLIATGNAPVTISGLDAETLEIDVTGFAQGYLAHCNNSQSFTWVLLPSQVSIPAYDNDLLAAMQALKSACVLQNTANWEEAHDLGIPLTGVLEVVHYEWTNLVPVSMYAKSNNGLWLRLDADSTFAFDDVPGRPAA